MAEFIDAAPSGWKRNFSLSEVYRDGALRRESFEFAVDGKVRHWGQVFSFDSPVKAEVTASRAGQYVELYIEVAARVLASCSRCLEPAGVAINGNLRYLFTLRPFSESGTREGKAPEGESGDEEIIGIASWDEPVNLGELVWEALITALPPSVICSGECRGLCPRCGANLNKSVCDCKNETGDPRFESLGKLLEDEGQDGKK